MTAAQLPCLVVLPVVDVPSTLRSNYLDILLLWALLKGASALWRAVRPQLIFKMEALPFPNKRQWCIPTATLKRWSDPDRVKTINLPHFRGHHPVVYLGIRGVAPVIRKP